jgi:cytochrome c oxidase subunit 2
LVTDKPLVLYRGYSYRFLVTSEDVLHAWSVPELGVKVDAVPGRTNQYLAAPNRVGVFYGQCSEICGVGHGFMPITIKVTNLKKDGW